MSSGLAIFDQLLGALRFALAVIAGIFAVFCVIDWLVRTRRVNLFGPLARFSRSRIDPILEPIERKVVRAGGNPVSAPLWALAAVVIGGILLISVLDFIRALLTPARFVGARKHVLGLWEPLRCGANPWCRESAAHRISIGRL